MLSLNVDILVLLEVRSYTSRQKLILQVVLLCELVVDAHFAGVERVPRATQCAQCFRNGSKSTARIRIKFDWY